MMSHEAKLMEIQNLPPLLTVEEVGTLTRKSERSVLRGIKTRRIPAVRVLGTYRIPRDYVIELRAQAMRSVVGAVV
jgi:excisionase family DNA binding protein